MHEKSPIVAALLSVTGFGCSTNAAAAADSTKIVFSLKARHRVDWVIK